jgi:hypothetical protein
MAAPVRRNEKGGAVGSAPEMKTASQWLAVVLHFDLYFYCFKLGGVIWQVFSWQRHEGTGSGFVMVSFCLFHPRSGFEVGRMSAELSIYEMKTL